MIARRLEEIAKDLEVLGQLRAETRAFGFVDCAVQRSERALRLA
jgi:hypothetical protein